MIESRRPCAISAPDAGAPCETFESKSAPATRPCPCSWRSSPSCRHAARTEKRRPWDHRASLPRCLALPPASTRAIRALRPRIVAADWGVRLAMRARGRKAAPARRAAAPRAHRARATPIAAREFCASVATAARPVRWALARAGRRVRAAPSRPIAATGSRASAVIAVARTTAGSASPPPIAAPA
jgi:hypothetical protein